MKCYVCGRTQICPSEGRVIDGSWENDKHLPDEVKGKWVCCYNCYNKLVRQKLERLKDDITESNGRGGN